MTGEEAENNRTGELPNSDREERNDNLVTEDHDDSVTGSSAGDVNRSYAADSESERDDLRENDTHRTEGGIDAHDVGNDAAGSADLRAREYWQSDRQYHDPESRYRDSYKGRKSFNSFDSSENGYYRSAGSGYPEHSKPVSKGKKWTAVIAMALVFGLIVGGVATGVHYAASSFSGFSSRKQEAEKEPSSGNKKKESKAPDVLNTEKEEVKRTTTDASKPKRANNGDLSVAEVAENALPSMVTISTMSVQQMQSVFGGTQSYDVEGAGTGIIIGENETELLVATNNHVIENATQLSVGFIDETVCEASIKGTDAANDIAVIAVKLSDIKPETKAEIRKATIGDSDQMALGDQVVAIGNALGYGQSVTSGYISAKNRELKLADEGSTFTSSGLLQTDAAINAGNSGGGLFNMKGELIGINEAKSSGNGSRSQASVDNVGFAIPTDKALPILQKLMKQETREIVEEDNRGYLGVNCADVSDEYASIYDMPTGVCFTNVLKDGPADKAGAKKGDVLTEFDGTRVTNYNNLKGVLQYYSSGDTVELLVKRADNGEYKDVRLSLTLGTADEIGMNDQTPMDQNTQQDPSEQENDSEEENDAGSFDPFRGTPFEGIFGN